MLELPCFSVEGIVVGLDFRLEVEISSEDLEGFGEGVFVGRPIGALADGFEELLDGPVIDRLGVGPVGVSKNRIGDVLAKSLGRNLGDCFFDPDDELGASVQPFGFVVGIGTRGDLRGVHLLGRIGCCLGCSDVLEEF